MECVIYWIYILNEYYQAIILSNSTYSAATEVTSGNYRIFSTSW